MSFSISGKTAIVTGAANGIGLSIARNFADRGANVMCADMDEARLKEELGPHLDEGNMRYFAGDLRQRLTIANLISATIDAFDQVDILINASRQVMTTDVLDVEDTSVEVLLEQNMMTSLRLSQQVAKRMIKQSADQTEGPVGTIVNLSSIAASLKSSMIENSEWRDEIEEKTPLGRVAGPGELVDAVQFLASDASAFMTGEVVTVDGGRSLLDSVAAPAH